MSSTRPRPARPPGPRPKTASHVTTPTLASSPPTPSTATTIVKTPSPISPATPISTPATTSTFAPPPPLSFDPPPIPWKGLPLEAAQWTFTSAQLQETVSRAIRLSARESFIRLLSPEALDRDIPAEFQRLEDSRLQSQAKFRFLTQRRAMLLQALHSFATAPPPAVDKDKSGSTLSALISQLSSNIISADETLQSLVVLSEQRAQLGRLIDRHWASALSVALRKLNKSYERRMEEIRKAGERISQLEDELGEAWAEAEKLADEMDAEDDSDGGNDLEDNIDTGGVVGSDGDLTEEDEVDEEFDTANISIGEVVHVTRAVASKALLLHENKPSEEVQPLSEPVQKQKQDQEVRSIRSTKSTKSGKSMKSTKSARTDNRSRVNAARTRSRTASVASLRLPKNLRGVGVPAGGEGEGNGDVVPPVPIMGEMMPGKSFLDFSGSFKGKYQDKEAVRSKDNATSQKVENGDADENVRRDEWGNASTPTPFSTNFDRSIIPPIWLDTDRPRKRYRGDARRTHQKQPVDRNRERVREIQRVHSAQFHSDSDLGAGATNADGEVLERSQSVLLVRPDGEGIVRNGWHTRSPSISRLRSGSWSEFASRLYSRSTVRSRPGSSLLHSLPGSNPSLHSRSRSHTPTRSETAIAPALKVTAEGLSSAPGPSSNAPYLDLRPEIAENHAEGSSSIDTHDKGSESRSFQIKHDHQPFLQFGDDDEEDGDKSNLIPHPYNHRNYRRHARHAYHVYHLGHARYHSADQNDRTHTPMRSNSVQAHPFRMMEQGMRQGTVGRTHHPSRSDPSDYGHGGYAYDAGVEEMQGQRELHEEIKDEKTQSEVDPERKLVSLPVDMSSDNSTEDAEGAQEAEHPAVVGEFSTANADMTQVPAVEGTQFLEEV